MIEQNKLDISFDFYQKILFILLDQHVHQVLVMASTVGYHWKPSESDRRIRQWFLKPKSDGISSDGRIRPDPIGHWIHRPGWMSHYYSSR